MITIKEARIQQKKAQKKSLLIFLGSFLILSAICAGIYFVGELEFYCSLYLSLFIFLFISYKIKIIEFVRVKEYEGEVTYFNVRREQIKKTNSHQAGNTYDTYSVLFADIIIKDKNNKIRHKTFRYTKEYDNVKAGDRAIVLRFVDKPIIHFQK